MAGTQDRVDYTAELELRLFAALVDLHPTAGTFRLTWGFFCDKNRVKGRATSTTTIEINDTTCPAGEGTGKCTSTTRCSGTLSQGGDQYTWVVTRVSN